MSLRSCIPIAVPAAALLALTSQSQAQQSDVTVDEVEAYLQQVRDEAAEIVQAEDYDRILDWTQTNVADGAVLQGNIAMSGGGDHRGFASMTLEKEDILRMGGVFASVARQQAIEDYSLELDIRDIAPHGTGAATAKVRWTESFTMRAPAPEDGAAQQAEGQAISVDATANCAHLLQRNEDGEFAIGLTTCTGELRQ